MGCQKGGIPHGGTRGTLKHAGRGGGIVHDRKDETDTLGSSCGDAFQMILAFSLYPKAQNSEPYTHQQTRQTTTLSSRHSDDIPENESGFMLLRVSGFCF